MREKIYDELKEELSDKILKKRQSVDEFITIQKLCWGYICFILPFGLGKCCKKSWARETKILFNLEKKHKKSLDVLEIIKYTKYAKQLYLERHKFKAQKYLTKNHPRNMVNEVSSASESPEEWTTEQNWTWLRKHFIKDREVNSSH